MVFISHDERESLARGWARRDEQAQKDVRAILGTAGWSEDAIASQTFIQNIEIFERADRMIMAYQRHRNSLKRRIERHREAKANRQATSDVPQADEGGPLVTRPVRKMVQHDQSAPSRGEPPGCQG